MPEIKLKIEDLILDHDNPRINHAEGQQDALQKIVKDQKKKLVKLAQSIVERGMNPMDRLLVLRLNQKPVKFISLEGNRRVAVLKLLSNPAVMSGLEIAPDVKRAIERLSKTFKKSVVEPLSCFELTSRDDSRYWLALRHNIGHGGAGVEAWSALAERRSRGTAPVIQALELVTERSGLTSAERASITEKFPTTTLERFLEDRKVRKALGLDVKDGQLITNLPANEIAKPLRKIVLDLATGVMNVRDLITTDDMIGYIGKFGKQHSPQLSKALEDWRTLDEIPVTEFSPVRSKVSRRRLDPSDRKTAVPRGCPIKVTSNRIADIYMELRTLKLDNAPNSISVLLRVFLELSVDHFLESKGVKLKHVPQGSTREVHKKLDKKLTEVVEMLVASGVPKSRFASVTRALHQDKSPLSVDLLHHYVHDRFTTPTPRDLKAAWDHAQPLLEQIWP